jgi:hypothetical protein
MFPANDFECFGRVLLLSRDSLHVIWIILSFEVFFILKSLVSVVDLALLAFSLSPHLRISAFLLVIL